MAFAIDSIWYHKHPLRWWLWPLSFLFQMVSGVRRFYLTRFHQVKPPVPIIVVGNITVGGVGKTPLVIALAKAFLNKGIRVGIVSRGYGAQIKTFPYEVSQDDSATQVGDEPLLLAYSTGCPVVIAPKRVQAVQYLVKKHQSQIILSDDGLQHYAMGRTLEIAVIDGVRQLGNGLCLPAGPLREKASRLQNCDLLVVNGGKWPKAHVMHCKPSSLVHLCSRQSVSPQSLTFPVAAVAAIGHPQRFFNTLQDLNIPFVPYSFPDHHLFQKNELQFPETTVLMTEKDAIKCQAFAAEHWYFLPIEAQLDEAFWQALWAHKPLQELS